MGSIYLLKTNLFDCLEELCLDDSQLILTAALFQFHFVGGFRFYFYQLPESVLVTCIAFQTDRNGIGTYRLVYVQVDISQTLLCSAAPYQLFACVYFQRVAARTPSVQFQTNVKSVFIR